MTVTAMALDKCGSYTERSALLPWLLYSDSARDDNQTSWPSGSECHMILRWITMVNKLTNYRIKPICIVNYSFSYPKGYENLRILLGI